MYSIDRQLVAIYCKISPGAFSGERVFSIDLANGDKYKSLAPRQFCWNGQNQIVEKDEPQSEIEGLIAARIVEDIEGQFIVEIPDGNIIAVKKELVEKRPTNIKPPQPKHYVSV
jgi:hypothetical protein